MPHKSMDLSRGEMLVMLDKIDNFWRCSIIWCGLVDMFMTILYSYRAFLISQINPDIKASRAFIEFLGVLIPISTSFQNWTSMYLLESCLKTLSTFLYILCRSPALVERLQ